MCCLEHHRTSVLRSASCNWTFSLFFVAVLDKWVLFIRNEWKKPIMCFSSRSATTLLLHSFFSALYFHVMRNGYQMQLRDTTEPDTKWCQPHSCSSSWCACIALGRTSLTIHATAECLNCHYSVVQLLRSAHTGQHSTGTVCSLSHVIWMNKS